MKGKGITGLILAVVAGIFMLLPAVSFAEDLVVIGNRSVPEASLSQKMVKNIYLGKMKSWSNGKKIIFVKLNKGEISKKFLTTYVKKNQNMFGKYWKKKVFTGAGKAPKSFAKEKDLVAFVEQTAGAIGYVSPAANTDQVKILSVKGN